MRGSSRVRRWSVLAVAGAMALAACGDDGGNASDEESGGDEVESDGTSDDGTGDNGSGDEESGDEESGDGESGDGESGDDGSGDDGSGDEESGDNGSGDTFSDPTAFEQPEGEPDRDARFTYAYPIGVSRLDPHQASISQDATTLFPAYDRIVHLTPEGELVPGLAEDWEFSDDASTLTLNVRPDVTFHDGAELDAQAVKTNLDRAVGIEGSSVASDLASLESVEVVDPMTVQLNLSNPDVSILGALADRAGILVSPQAIADDVNLDANMVGAGPYQMVHHVQDDTTVFERNEDYWDQENVPDVAELEIRVLGDAASRMNAIRTGQIHSTTLTPDEVENIEDDPAIRVMSTVELQYVYIVQNRSRSQQDDLRIRQGLLHGLDREAICDSLLDGECVITDQPFPPGHPAHNEDIDEVLYPYDPETAQSLFDEAGVEELELSLLTPGGLPTYPEISQVIQAQWGDLGVTVNIDEAVPQSLGEAMFAEERGDTMLATWGGRPDPAMTLDQRAGAESFANPGGHTTDEMMDLIAEANSTPDPDERDEVLQEGSREMAEQVLEMVVYFPKVPHVAREDAVFVPYLTAKPEFRDVQVLQ